MTPEIQVGLVRSREIDDGPGARQLCGGLNVPKQRLRLERLFEERDSPLLKGTTANRRVRLCADDENGQRAASLTEYGLELQTVHAWQPDIGNQTPAPVTVVCCQKRFGGRVHLHREAGQSQDQVQGVPHPIVIINDKDRGAGGHHSYPLDCQRCFEGRKFNRAGVKKPVGIVHGCITVFIKLLRRFDTLRRDNMEKDHTDVTNPCPRCPAPV